MYASFFKQRSDISHAKQARYTSFFNKGRTIRKAIGGGGGVACEVQKKYSRNGNFIEKIYARQLTMKNIHDRA